MFPVALTSDYIIIFLSTVYIHIYTASRYIVAFRIPKPHLRGSYSKDFRV